MYRLLPLIISLFLVSCSAEKAEQQKIAKRLQAWDAIIYDNPQAVKDSLNLLSRDRISEENLAYYNLLWNIMKDKCGEYIEVDSDTTIYKSLIWYRHTNDKRNLCRALLYSAKFYSEIAVHCDTTGLCLLKEAEEILVKNKINDIETKAEIFRYMGIGFSYKYKVLQNRSHYDEGIPEKYFGNSITLYKKLGKKREISLLYIDMIDSYLKNSKNRDKVFNLLEQLSKDSLSPEIKYNLYSRYYTYYFSLNDYHKAIEYTKRIISENLSKQLFSPGISLQFKRIALCYQKLNFIDSSIVYCDLSINASYEETHTYPISCYLMKYENYVSLNDYKNANEEYRIYHQKHAGSLVRLHNKKIKEGLFKSREDRMELLRDKQKDNNILYLLSMTSILLIFSQIVMLVIYRRKKEESIKNRIAASKRLLSIQVENNNTWVINQILKTSANAMPHLIDNINIEASRLRKSSKESSESLIDYLNNLRLNIKSDLAEIARDEMFSQYFPEVASLSILSPYEKIILILADFGYSNKVIAEMLATNQPSIRTIKSKIREKINSVKDLQFDPDERFSIFFKDSIQNQGV